MAELKPCPFCGSEADFMGETRSIKCKNCGGALIVLNPLISRLEVANIWNTRCPHKAVTSKRGDDTDDEQKQD